MNNLFGLKKFSLNKKMLCTLSFLLFNLPAYAEETAPDYSNNLTGDWKGARIKLYDCGLDVELVYRADGFYNSSGGIKKGGGILGNVDLKFSVDGEKLYNLSGSKVLIHFINDHGGKPNEKRVGSVQGIDNIEVETATTKLYQAWISQDFMDEKFSVLAGLHDLNSEFYVTPSAGLFIGPIYGIGGEFAVTGENGPSIFPTTALAVRAKVQPSEKFYFQTAVYDAVAGNPEKPKGTHINLRKKDGALLVAEMGTNCDFGNYSLGLWKYTKKFPHHMAVDVNDNPIKKISQGVYAMAEKVLCEMDENSNLTGFLRFGKANGAVSEINYNWSGGLVYSGFIKDRNDSKIGFAVSQAGLSKQFRLAEQNEDRKVPKRETIFELTVSDKLMPWLQVQPDVQYIYKPAKSVDVSEKYVKNAFVIGIKTVITF